MDENGTNILLVNPWITDFAAFDMWLRPTALLRIGALLRVTGMSVSLIDCLDRSHPSRKTPDSKDHRDGSGKYFKTKIPKPDVLRFVPRVFGRYGITVAAFEEELSRVPKPDAVLVTSSMTYWYPGAFEAISIIKKRWPDAPVVLGGRYATLCAAHAREHSGADFVYEGALSGDFSGLMHHLIGRDVEVPESFADFPVPAHDLQRDRSSAVVALTRGCPFRCTYCVSHKLSPRFERRTTESAIAEIKWLVEELGARDIAFCDDALLAGSEDLLAPLLRFVIENKYRVRFHTPNAVHAKLVTPEIAALMKWAGFAGVILGLESADAGFNRKTGGKAGEGDFERAVIYLREAGFNRGEIGAYIIMGHPDQTEAEILATAHAAAELEVEPVPAEYSPIPGSVDFDAAVASFRRPPDTDPLLHNSSIVLYQHPKITPDGFSRIKQECTTLRKQIRENRRHFVPES